MKYLLSHGHLIVDGNREYLDGALLIDKERIIEVFPQTNKIKRIEGDYTTIDLGGSLVMPGFFDSHTHGGSGISFDNADIDDLEKVSDDFAKDGTTSFLASLSYDLNKEEYLKQLSVFEQYNSKHSRFMGIHMEGPFLSKKHIGVGDGRNFMEPDIELVKQFLENSSKIKQMTIAYENDGAKPIGKLLKENGEKISEEDRTKLQNAIDKAKKDFETDENIFFKLSANGERVRVSCNISKEDENHYYISIDDALSKLRSLRGFNKYKRLLRYHAKKDLYNILIDGEIMLLN